MYIKNYATMETDRSLLYDQRTPAVVVKTGDDTGKDNVLGVFIPRYMFGLPISKGPYENNAKFDVSSKLLNTKNKSIGATSAKVKNYVILPISVIPNAATPHFTYGENVFVDMADKDLKSLFILPYSLGEVNRRTQDMYTILCPNFKKPGETLGNDNSYGFQIDTINQVIGLWTTKVNDEKSVYTFGINAAEGKILISDDGKRTIEVVTDDDSITIQNEKNSKWQMVGDTINIEAGTINIKAKNDINIESSTISRKIDKIKTESSEDIEEVDKLSIKGNEFKGEYNKQEWSGSSYKNKTSKWVVDSPISGFTKILTANSFSIWGNAGMNPLPTCANINSSGIAAFGNPSLISLPLAKQQPLMIALSLISAALDTVGAVHGIPPTLSASIAGMGNIIASNNAKG